ncbi:MAG TPA: TatD family hydrolase [Thermodesulfovibrionales bacterium]|nr:TatD family hydrolase [Thermodesulfovibrionales bacterium]
MTSNTSRKIQNPKSKIQNPEDSSRVTLIDTHCHLDMFDQEADAVVQRAKDAGIEAIITVGSDPGSNESNLAIARKHDIVYAAVGVHPHDAKDFTPDIFERLRAWSKDSNELQATGDAPKIQNPKSKIQNLENLSRTTRQASRSKVVAVGETGLDYHYDHSPREVQKDVFRKHLAIAEAAGLPVIVHSREAKADTLDILRESETARGVLHCFSGDMDMAERVMEMGLYISIAGPVTFRNAGRLQEIVRSIPDDYLLVETDAPYLAPVPLRGRRNEPSCIIHTAKRLAELRGVSPEDIARITTVNARRLFRTAELPDYGEIAYRIRDSLYLNVTNRCTNKCSFCVRFHKDFVKGHKLRLAHEPSEDELKGAIGDPSRYREIVFCGYGEPLLRLNTVKNIARWIKNGGGSVRINTNGHGNLIHKRNILPELRGIVDSLSVSLDAHDRETYDRICGPSFENAFREVVTFIEDAKGYIPDVQATVVEMDGVDIEKCRELAGSLGVPLRVRKLNVVG